MVFHLHVPALAAVRRLEGGSPACGGGHPRRATCHRTCLRPIARGLHNQESFGVFIAPVHPLPPPCAQAEPPPTLLLAVAPLAVSPAPPPAPPSRAATQSCLRLRRWPCHPLPRRRLHMCGGAKIEKGSLREYMAHDCLNTYVCVLYCSPCAPLMAPWLVELEGTSLAIV